MQQKVNLLWSIWTRITRKVLRNKWIKISILLFLCFIFYMLSTKHISRKLYDADVVLGPAFSIIKNKGKIHTDDIPLLSYQPESIKEKGLYDLRNAISALVRTCNTESLTGCELEQRYPRGKAILTLFTTWTFDKNKFYINNNTLYNWKRLNNVRLVVFTNDQNVSTFSRRAGWEIMPIPKEAAGAPVLPAMFVEVMANYESELYGFANGDILFTDSLTTTIEAILCQLKSQLKSRALLVIGRRTNVPSKVIQDAALSLDVLKNLALQHGSLFQKDAEDYFIANEHFPWRRFLPLAIGIPGYDNWLVTYARLKNAVIVDATDTILCIHQTLESRGNYESQNRGEYNIEMVEKQRLPFSVFRWGRTDCADTISWYDLCNHIVIIPRSKLAVGCQKYHWTHRFLLALGIANDTVSI